VIDRPILFPHSPSWAAFGNRNCAFAGLADMFEIKLSQQVLGMIHRQISLGYWTMLRGCQTPIAALNSSLSGLTLADMGVWIIRSPFEGLTGFS
jgi:hypothetical protein